MTFGQDKRIRKMTGFFANPLQPSVRLPRSRTMETQTMKWTLVRYRAKSDRADENQRLSAAVFDEIKGKAPAGLRYAVFRLPDDTFVHLASLEDGGTPLSSFETFRAFQKDIRERCAEAPQPAEPRLVGNYGMLSGKT
jgi:hypothetical protein